MARNQPKTEYSAEELGELIEMCADFTHDPVGFVYAMFPWGEEGTELEGRQPSEWQLRILQKVADGVIALEDAIRIAIASGHGIGKSALVSWLIIWAMATREDTKGVVTANTERQLMTKTWSELAKWHRLSLCAPLFKYEASSYHSVDKDHEKTWRIDAIPWTKDNSEAFAGLHNQKKRILIIFDEASAIDAVIWEVVEGALTDDNTEIIWAAFGNPTRPNGRFYDCFKKFRSMWHCENIDSRTVPITNKKLFEKWAAAYGEDSDFFKVRVRGLFPSAGTRQHISLKDVEEGVRRYANLQANPKQYEFAPVIFGIDPAWEGMDKFVVYMRQGNFSKVLLDIPKNDNDIYVAGLIAALADRYKMTQGFIDQGYGTGVYSALKSMGRDNFRLIPFSMKATNDYYCNKRIEMWDLLRLWFKDGGAIENRQDVIDDLTAPEAFINTRGKLQLESKDDMKDRGLPSPNYGDALALTFAFPVIPNRFSAMRTAKKQGKIRKVGAM